MQYPSQVRLEDTPCPVGCLPDDEKILIGIDRLHGLPGDFTVVRCRSCGLMRTNPRPTPGTIGYYYPEDYGPYASTRIDLNAEPIVKPNRSVWWRVLSNLIQFNTSNIPPLRPGRMLEIGCASGSYLHRMAQQEWQVEGIEFAEEPAAKARALGYPVQTTMIETASPPEARFDLIVGWMVLEHLHDPVRVLQKMREWSTDESWLVLSTPNAASWEFSVFRDAWYALQLPAHLFHYTPRSIRTVLRAGGWQVERIFYQRNLGNIVASLAHLLEKHGHAGRLSEQLRRFPEANYRLHQMVYPLAWSISLLNQAGRMTIWAKKNR